MRGLIRFLLLLPVLIVMAGCAIAPTQPPADGNGGDDGSTTGDGAGTDDGGMVDDGGTDGGGTDGGGTGDVSNGQAVVEQTCSVCHGNDGASGFAPDIQGESADEIAERIGGGGGHLTYDLTDQEVLDVEAYLASF